MPFCEKGKYAEIWKQWQLEIRRFQQLAHICQHPGCGNMLSVIYYGATAPRDCPMRKPSAALNTLQGEYKFSPWRILDAAAFCSQNEAFVSYCKQAFSHGTFSTYADGEPVFLTGDMESIMKKWKDGKDGMGCSLISLKSVFCITTRCLVFTLQLT